MDTKNLSQIEYDYEDFYIAHRFNIFNKKDVLSKHIHDCYEVIFVKKGEFKYYYEDSSLLVEDGDLLITPPHIYHYFEAENTNRCERYVMLIRSEKLQSLLEVKQPSKINILDNEIMHHIFTRFDYYNENISNKKILDNVKELITYLVGELVINISNVKDFEDVKSSFSNPIFSSIIRYINENLSDISSANSLIEKFHISESYLHKLFNKYLKITPKEYLVLKKMSLAKRLLNEGVLLSEIAKQCGFISYTAFYRTFIKYYKKNPAKMVEKK